MAISDKIGAHLPYLRRYARALTGSQASGDTYVRATLEAALADGELLSLVLQNLVGNAVKFSSGGTVRVGAESDSTADRLS